MSTPATRVYPGPDTYPGTDPSTRVHEQVRVHLLDSARTVEVGTDISARLVAAGIDRGGDATGTVLAPQVGTATLTLEGDHTRYLTPDRYLAVMHHDGRRLFTGKIVDATAEDDQLPGRRWRTVTRIRCADALAELANTKRYSVASPNETVQERLDRLMLSARHLPYAIRNTHPDADQSPPIIHRAYVHESDLASHISLLADGALLGWCINRQGGVQLARVTRSIGGQPPPRSTSTLITDGSTPTDPGVDLTGRPKVSPVRISRGFTTAELSTVITVKRYGRKANPEGGADLQKVDVFGPLVHTSLADTWGRRALEVETAVTNTPADGEMTADERVARHYAGLRWPHHRPRAVRLNAGLHGWPDLDVLHVVEVLHEGTMHRLYVSAIRHTITATSWVADIELGDTGADTQPAQPVQPPVVLHPAESPPG